MSTTRGIVACAAAILALQAALLYLLGQPPIAASGVVKLWEGVVLGAGNSQHLTDWYTFSHLIHGFVFYGALWFFFPRLAVRQRFLLALALEAGWEVFENTPMVIEHYRQQALAQGYAGDSILNSVSDTLAMALGFFLASRWPAAASVAVALVLEAWVGWQIRDNLTLNIVGFFHQFDLISEWQQGGN